MSSSVVVSCVRVLLLSSVTSCSIFYFLSVEFCQSVESSSRPVNCYIVKCPCELHNHTCINSVSMALFPLNNTPTL